MDQQKKNNLFVLEVRQATKSGTLPEVAISGLPGTGRFVPESAALFKNPGTISHYAARYK